MRILVPFGTRPEIIKLAPVVRTLKERGFEVTTVATGQHYDGSLTDAFYEQLAFHPDARWTLEGDDVTRTAEILKLAHQEVSERKPDLVLLLGDTYTVPLFCLAARRYRVPIAHLEAGLRSFNETSLEEVHRKVAGALASLHFAPTRMAADFLRAEGVPDERIKVVGNPVIDVLIDARVRALPPEERQGVVFTAHRATNVDDPERLDQIVDLVLRLAAEVGPVTFPVHPRTRARLEEFGRMDALTVDSVRLLPPAPYRAMLTMLSGAKVIVTDSGGLQEEASWLGVPVVVLRHSTPRWEGVAAGTAVLTGVNVERALEASVRFASPEEQERVQRIPCPYGDGHTAERVADLLQEAATERLLRLEEPLLEGTLPPARRPAALSGVRPWS
jgi:UDP-N-acetylglucosamine 2-epimerase (non-hydrolysing)